VVAGGRGGAPPPPATGDLSQAAVEAFGDQGEWFETVEELIDAIGKDIAEDVNVLVKGSRGMRMERVVDALEA
jgi:UDP-N-acetylmuramoyl-tripeptide--D-alanyl-D-alanine ligase